MTAKEAISILEFHNPFLGTDKKLTEAFDMAIKALTAQQWIPCSERLPERNQICIVTDETRRCAYEYELHDETYDKETGWTYLGNKIIAWMPLPESYKGES